MKKQKTYTIKLDTDYKRYGNDTGMQFDTLARAFKMWTENELLDSNLQWIEESRIYALDQYDYEKDFLATLDKGAAQKFLADRSLLDDAVKQHERELREKAISYELDETHPLAIKCQEARDSAEKDLMDAFFLGDRDSLGICGNVSRYLRDYSHMELEYRRDSDELVLIVTDDREAVKEWNEEHQWDDPIKTIRELADRIGSDIETAAYEEHARENEQRAKSRAENERVREYQKKCAAIEAKAKDEERVKALQAIIKK